MIRGGSDTPSGTLSTERFYNLSKEQLVQIIGYFSAIRKQKYKQRNIAKYGTISKAISERELDLLLKITNNQKARMAFKCMAYLGLRVGEVVDMRITDLDFTRNMIIIRTEKAKTLDSLYMHDKVLYDLKSWVDKNRKTIEKHEGYIFFSDYKSRVNISPHWIRNQFREVIEKIGAGDTYGISDESYPNRAQRRLHRLTTHSLRHYYITKIYTRTKNPMYTQRLARHKDFKSTQVYIHYNQGELNNSLKSAFEGEHDSDMGEFLEAFKQWKTMKKQ